MKQPTTLIIVGVLLFLILTGRGERMWRALTSG